MSRAEDLFQRLSNGGEEAINEYFAQRQSEELFLDFKRSADRGIGRTLHQDDMTNLAKAISGFGNSEGGILIWGVDCNDKDNTGDFPKARVPIENPARFVSRLEGAVSGRTVPPHPGVRHLAISSNANPDEGFVVTYISKSYLVLQTVPSQDFYIRAGSNFVKAPYGVLAALFGRAPQAELLETWSYTRPKIILKADRRVDFEMRLQIHSAGPGLARDLYVNLQIFLPSGFKIGSQPEAQDWTGYHYFGYMTSLVTKQDFRLPPSGMVPVLKLLCQLSPPFDRPFSYKLEFGHSTAPMRSVQVHLEPEEIEAAYNKIISAKVTSDRANDFITALFKQNRIEQVET